MVQKKWTSGLSYREKRSAVVGLSLLGVIILGIMAGTVIAFINL